ncbi:hypothetical protein C0J52_22379 [Blattella germanica]|nr:hypothetical protein C0J52_22379 [Blattella germanica]
MWMWGYGISGLWCEGVYSLTPWSRDPICSLHIQAQQDAGTIDQFPRDAVEVVRFMNCISP